MTVIAYTLAAVLAVIAVLVGLLWITALAARRWADDRGPDPLVAGPARPAVAPGRGWLNTDEEDTQGWCIETTARDIARLDAIQERLVGHRLRALLERSLRQLHLTPAERDFARMRSGASAVEDGGR